MKLIFLDIDGVLNNTQRAQWLHENVKPSSGFGMPWELDDGNFTIETIGWDPRNVEALMHIVDETSASIIISSTWRIGRRVPFFRQCFEAFGVNPPVIGMTPVLHNKIRGDEVNNIIEQMSEVSRWVCLDDDGDFHPENNLVQTNMDVGLTMKDAEQAIEILNEEKTAS